MSDQTLAQWLNSRPTGRDHDATPVTVTIGCISYSGARFQRDQQSLRYGNYTETLYYLLGSLPAGWLHGTETRTGTTYALPGDDGDWYVSGYCPAADGDTHEPELHRQYCPFGASFMLARWPHEMFGHRIDQYGGRRKGAKREPAEVAP